MSSATVAVKKWTAGEIAERIMSDDRWTYRALFAVHARQTASEQASRETIIHNGVGFTGSDAAWLSIMADSLKIRGSLSPKQLHCVRFHRNGRPRLAKYAGQLAKIANRKG